jgi:hypothetical protein
MVIHIFDFNLNGTTSFLQNITLRTQLLLHFGVVAGLHHQVTVLLKKGDVSLSFINQY